MIANLSIRDILVRVGLPKAKAHKLARQAKLINRTRRGASVLYVPARSLLGEDLFVKVYDNASLFQRELTTINLLASNQKTSSLPPRVVYVQEQKKILVTTRVKGTPLTTLIRDASRVDKVLTTRYPIQNIVSSIEHLIGLLANVSIYPSHFMSGCDHTTSSICKRIVNKYEQLGISGDEDGLNDTISELTRRIESSREIAEKERFCLTYVHGDFAPSNIFVDEHNIHLIDFEDSGYGPAGRDLAYLIYLIRPLMNNYCYLGHRVRALIVELEKLFSNLFSIPEVLLKLWELEWCLNEIWLLRNGSVSIVNSLVEKKRIKNRIRKAKEILDWVIGDDSWLGKG